MQTQIEGMTWNLYKALFTQTRQWASAQQKRPTGAVKVLDFGLAKMAEPVSAPGSDPVNSPTLTLEAATRVGAIMGTAGYMASEQAKGKAVDKRADIFAFGVVLYEMLQGGRLFEKRDGL